jgi:hypothetical protein
MDSLDQPRAELAQKADCPPITRASVRVMRSHDYCHFEVVLGTEGETEMAFRADGRVEAIPGTAAPITAAQVDALRKEAARLVDKAVAQFKFAKSNAEHQAEAKRMVGWDSGEADRIRAKGEADRTPQEKAHLKRYDDAVFHANRRPYDYEDDWQEDDES